MGVLKQGEASAMDRRTLSPLEKLHSSMGRKVFSVAAGAGAQDKKALKHFFVTTNKSELDWDSETTSGSGRLGWLDDTVELGVWQGVTVDATGDSSAKGRVSKLILPRNRINGPIAALKPLTYLRKLSLWKNTLEGGLESVASMVSMVGVRVIELIHHTHIPVFLLLSGAETSSFSSKSLISTTTNSRVHFSHCLA